MLAAGEADVARDELRWLLEDCPDFLAAHQKLGEIATEHDDPRLARAHFGHVFDLVRKALSAAAHADSLLYELPENHAAHESGKGLAWSLRQLGEAALAREVVEQLLRWDPSDPLGVGAWRE